MSGYPKQYFRKRIEKWRICQLKSSKWSRKTGIEPSTQHFTEVLYSIFFLTDSVVLLYLLCRSLVCRRIRWFYCILTPFFITALDSMDFLYFTSRINSGCDTGLISFKAKAKKSRWNFFFSFSFLLFISFKNIHRRNVKTLLQFYPTLTQRWKKIKRGLIASKTVVLNRGAAR